MTVEELFNIKDPNDIILTDGSDYYTVEIEYMIEMNPLRKYNKYKFINIRTYVINDFEVLIPLDTNPILRNPMKINLLSTFKIVTKQKETQMKTTFKQDETPIQQIKFPAFMKSKNSDLIVLFFDETSGVVVKSNL